MMARAAMRDRFPVFRNAPIDEAVLEIRFVAGREVSFEEIAAFGDKSAPDSQRQETFVGEFGLRMSLTEGAAIENSKTAITGYSFRDEKRRRVLQLGLQNFSVHRLRPYEHWEKLRDDAKGVWESYSKLVGATTITRIGLRYVNRIDLPFDAPFDDYLTSPPTVSPELKFALENFFVSLALGDAKRRAKANVVQTTLEVTAEKALPIVLDIDVFKQFAGKDGEVRLWDDFEELREFKNEIFYGSLTKRAKEMFE